MTCATCAVRFYDLGHVPAVCPKCGAEQRVTRVASPYSNRTAPKRWLQRGAPLMAVEPEPEPAEAEAEAAEPDSEGDPDAEDEVTVEEVDEVG